MHLSSTPPPELSAHGWWIRFSGPARYAVVTVQIQQRFNGGFVDVDIVGHRDTPEKLYTNLASVSCSVLGRDA